MYQQRIVALLADVTLAEKPCLHLTAIPDAPPDASQDRDPRFAGRWTTWAERD